MALGWRVIELTIIGAFQFREPAQGVTNGPGIWLAGLGLAILSRAIYEMAAEPVHR